MQQNYHTSPNSYCMVYVDGGDNASYCMDHHELINLSGYGSPQTNKPFRFSQSLLETSMEPSGRLLMTRWYF